MSTNDKLVPGMVLGRYELLVPIAQGGMATVWAARQRGTRGFNKTVAIKTMLPALSDDPQFEQMFLDEAALAAKIQHPNVAQILDLGEQDDILYIVMEWVDGEAISVLTKALKKNNAQIPMRLSLRVGVQAAAALHAAHELRNEEDVPLHLVHRDVSPQNILCTYDGIVKLVDFGVAKAVGRAGGETTAGQLKGKVPYMSPEQARGGVIDRRTDVFALGIVLYRLTAGQHPFLGENDLATMRNIISRPVLPPRVKNPSFPKEIEQVIIKCLQKEPERRYQTMVELGQALERVLGGMGAAEDDLGAFVRNTMGDRGTRRRAEIREAVRVADERYATGTHALVTIPSPQTMHEHVSEVVLTKMSTGVMDEPISARSMSGSGVDSGVSGTPPTHTPPPSAGSWPSGVLGAPEPHSTSQQAVMVASTQGHDGGEVSIPGLTRRSRKPGIVLGVAAAVAAMIIGVVAIRSGTRSPRGTRTQAGGSKPTAVAVTAAPPTAAPTAAPVLPPTAAVTAAPTAAPTTAPTATAAAVAAAPTMGKPWPKGPVPSAKPTAEADPPDRNLSNGKVPIYTNPGF